MWHVAGVAPGGSHGRESSLRPVTAEATGGARDTLAGGPMAASTAERTAVVVLRPR